MKSHYRIFPVSRVVLLFAFLATATRAADLPVRNVVIFKHGVGYFERAGTLRAGETAILQFKADEMNDVLKSLTLTDAGGDVKGLRYDSSIPLQEKLDAFPFRLNNGAPLSAVVDQLKGARIEMEFGPQKVAGEIVSARLIAGDKDHAEREQLTLMLDSGELRNVDLAAATSIRFSDPQLQLQFRDYLRALTGARSKDKRSIYIDSTDAKTRDVRATYITPMPAWKSSYRLLLEGAGGPSLLEGWAIVDNTTGDDWTNVRISLVSGKPISFVSQLYEPKYIVRRTAVLAEEESVAPTVYSGTVHEEEKIAAALPPVPSGVGGTLGGAVSAGLAGGRPASRMEERESLPKAAMASVQPSSVRDAAATDIADLFEYSIRNPVAVKKNESAMLPFLQQKIHARKLIIYSDPGKANPLNAAELTNNTGKTLDGGPITVFDGGSYAGEALVETVKAGDKRFISYGVDLGTRITTAFDSRTDNVRELHARNGVLTTTSAVVDKRTYAIRNVDARAKTLIIEHPVRSPFKLVNTPKPFETAKGVYRFEVQVPASGQVDFPVTEENVYSTTLSVASATPNTLLTYVENKSLPDTARRQLEAILNLKQQIAELDAQKRTLENEIANAARDEERLRQNITSLSNVSGQQQLVQEYARKLAGTETAISTARTRQAQLDQNRTNLQNLLNALIQKLDF